MSETTEIAKIDVNEIAATMSGASAVLTKNENLALAAEKGGQELLDTIEAEGMSDDIDADINEWQVKAKKAITMLNTRRVPITQVIDKMKKFFTELEGKIDPKKTDSVYAKLQIKRNDWAKAKAEAAKKKELEILKKQNVAAEKISLKAEISTQTKSIYNDKLFAFKKFVTSLYDKLTIENLADTKSKIEKVSIDYPVDKFNEIEPALFQKYMSQDDVDALVIEVRNSLYDECSANFREIMEAHKLDTLDKLPSRINELKSIAKAGEAEKRRLEGEAEKRKQEEIKRQEVLAKEKKNEDLKKIETEKQVATAGNLFDSAAALTQVKESTAKVREGYKIEVLTNIGWSQIFMFYFEKEGNGLSVEDFGKKTLNQMKAFAEKKAHKDDLKIISDHIIYEESYKAVASK